MGFDERFMEVLTSQSSYRVEVYQEFVDWTRFGGEEYEVSVSDYLRSKYKDVKIDVVVGVSMSAIAYLARARDDLFPNVPLVYGAVDGGILKTVDLGPNTTGATINIEVRRTVELALEVHPRTRIVAYALGWTFGERRWRLRLRDELAVFSDRVELLDLSDLTLEQLTERVATLPDDSIVLWTSFSWDADNLHYPAKEALGRVRRASKVPVYGVFDYDLGNGLLGGRIADVATNGEATGRLVARILEGEPVTRVEPVLAEPNPAMFDFRELRAHRVDERRLPAGSIVRFREPTVWESYGWYLLLAIGVIVIESLLIAGLAASRRRWQLAQQALADRLRFERLIADLSAHLVDVAPDELEGAIERGLERVRELLGVDWANLIRFVDESGASRVAHSATARGVRALAPPLDHSHYGDAFASLREGRIIAAARVEDLPDSLAAARATFERMGLRSVFAVPLQGDGEVLGALTLGTTREPYQWDDKLEPRLRLLADLFASAIVRKQSAEELERSEALGDAVLASLAAQVAVLDRGGTIVLVNPAWEASGHDPASPLPRLAAGESYLEACRASAQRGEETAQHALAGLQSVLAGTASTFAMEYVEAAGQEEVWYQMTVETMKRLEGGAVVSLRNITARKRAELKAEHRRQELAHVARVSTMGELAASLAHELNQPLSGVLTNAQTALRFLAVDPPNLDEVREILNDIVDDDRRAGEVIRRLRAMLQTGQIEPVALSLNVAVAEVERLLASDAILRNASIELSLAPDLPPVLGDRIQLQQVLLNLVVNAMDAMRGVAAEERRVTIRTELADAATAQVTVADRGTGIAEEKLGQVFQPFFSTKSEGMGMGLSIARTIVEAHGGTLIAANNPDRGATFILTLPVNRMEHHAVR